MTTETRTFLLVKWEHRSMVIDKPLRLEAMINEVAKVCGLAGQQSRIRLEIVVGNERGELTDSAFPRLRDGEAVHVVLRPARADAKVNCRSSDRKSPDPSTLPYPKSRSQPHRQSRWPPDLPPILQRPASSLGLRTGPVATTPSPPPNAQPSSASAPTSRRTSMLKEQAGQSGDGEAPISIVASKGNLSGDLVEALVDKLGKNRCIEAEGGKEDTESLWRDKDRPGGPRQGSMEPEEISTPSTLVPTSGFTSASTTPLSMPPFDLTPPFAALTNAPTSQKIGSLRRSRSVRFLDEVDVSPPTPSTQNAATRPSPLGGPVLMAGNPDPDPSGTSHAPRSSFPSTQHLPSRPHPPPTKPRSAVIAVIHPQTAASSSRLLTGSSSFTRGQGYIFSQYGLSFASSEGKPRSSSMTSTLDDLYDDQKLEMEEAAAIEMHRTGAPRNAGTVDVLWSNIGSLKWAVRVDSGAETGAEREGKEDTVNVTPMPTKHARRSSMSGVELRKTTAPVKERDAVAGNKTVRRRSSATAVVEAGGKKTKQCGDGKGAVEEVLKRRPFTEMSRQHVSYLSLAPPSPSTAPGARPGSPFPSALPRHSAYTASSASSSGSSPSPPFPLTPPNMRQRLPSSKSTEDMTSWVRNVERASSLSIAAGGMVDAVGGKEAASALELSLEDITGRHVTGIGGGMRQSTATL